MNSSNAYFSYQQQNLTNLRYRNKCKRLKKLLKNYVFENAALCDQVAQIQENILCVKEERRFLFKKLIEHDSEILNELSSLTNCQTQDSSGGPPPKKATKKRSNSEANKSSSSGSKSAKSIASQTKQNSSKVSVDTAGRPICPISLGNLNVIDLGEIVTDRPGYDTENWIYPIGYMATRIYGHMKDPEQKCVYTCKITDGGEFPRFEIIPDADMDYAIAGPSPDLCHAALLQTINNNTDARHIDVQPQGEWFFGLGHPNIMTLLQSSLNSKKLTNFKSFQVDLYTVDRENDPTVNYDALQKHIAISSYHTVPEIKEEPPDELLEQSDGNSCSFAIP